MTRSVMAVMMSSVLLGCVDYYNPKAVTTDLNYLVVDGYLNTGNDSTSFTLTTTSAIGGDKNQNIAKDALVRVEEQNGPRYTLTGDQNGHYTIAHIPVDPSKKYRLLVSLEGNDYESDFETIQSTPAIDSVSWKLFNNGRDDGVRFYVNTHGDDASSIFYLWKFDETWQYNSKYTSTFQLIGDTITERHNDIFFCFSHSESKTIFVGTSAALSRNLISEFPLNFLPLYSNKLSRRYSMNVQQISLTRGAYDYWLAMQKNSEELGSIFGPLPFQAPSNIHCTSNPAKQVIGYFNATSMQQKRVFVERGDVPAPHAFEDGYGNCSLHYVSLDSALVPTTNLIFDGVWDLNVLQGYLESSQYCVDCREQGGTLETPKYW